MRDGRLFDRWIRFSGVGALGIAVQLAVLGWLVRGVGLHYLWATLIAVEAAVLHNFLWHERWTWRERTGGDRANLAGRLTKFHLLNGVLSLGGNMLVMRILTGTFGVDPLAASIAGVVSCSVLNFAASEVYVFARIAAAALALVTLAPLAEVPAAAADTTAMTAVDLQARTLQAWTTYEQRMDARYGAATAEGAPFFALDAFGVKEWRATALKGGVAMSRMDRPGPGQPEIDVPDGRIHHWTGAIFIPATSLAQVLERLGQLAGEESKHYQDVIASKRLAKNGEHYTIFLKLQRSKIITATYNTEHDVVYRTLGARRAGGRSVSTRIAELEQAGTPQEREKKVGSDSGYLWRLNAYWRYEVSDGGVLIECESVSLSRAVPVLLRPFITGVVEGLARESLERTLVGLRTFLTGQTGPSGTVR
jgi:putative flippase GtrA